MWYKDILCKISKTAYTNVYKIFKNINYLSIKEWYQHLSKPFSLFCIL